MSERFSPLPGASTWFRLANRGSTFLPRDAVLPVDTWLRPTDSDVREGRARGRPAGLSVWEHERTTVEQAGLLVGKPSAEAFGMSVERCIEVGRRLDRSLAVVLDPLDDRAPQPGWSGHSLLEGLEWEGSTKRSRRALREAIVAEMIPVG